MGSGCDSVGRVVAFDTRGPQFDSSHRQNFIEHLFIINCIEKTKINKKRPGMAHFKKKKSLKIINFRQIHFKWNYSIGAYLESMWNVTATDVTVMSVTINVIVAASF